MLRNVYGVRKFFMIKQQHQKLRYLQALSSHAIKSLNTNFIKCFSKILQKSERHMNDEGSHDMSVHKVTTLNHNLIK